MNHEKSPDKSWDPLIPIGIDASGDFWDKLRGLLVHNARIYLAGGRIKILMHDSRNK